MRVQILFAATPIYLCTMLGLAYRSLTSHTLPFTTGSLATLASSVIWVPTSVAADGRSR
jgi:hypothetical protein